MTTGDINEVFQMKTSTPSRFLRSDKEILEYIKFCINISEISAEIKGRKNNGEKRSCDEGSQTERD